ncbi:conserved hypothetical protein [Nostocoides japonicum T1-X7]|uniref:Integral membrane protein n=1 Tax=Nostocoides japonicum T1-X7 TaxID=1194083 RepID=A0A077M014_9MICO|nr:SHOCT domain-containing protein [Tetrasphaera japonica]CCH77570.1 conserved hypothetical protein [Tetrasphaera japonica T1-X7]
MDYFSSFWHVIWAMFWMFAFVAYLIALFSIITDLFRDREMNGWLKALWVLFLFFLPFLTALVYLIFRGDGMARRNVKEAKASQERADDYIRQVAGTSPADEIAKAKSLLDAGTITQDEYDKLKAAALARQ